MSPPPSPLPPLYERWMRECLTDPVPNEAKATCGDCAMCAAPGLAPAPDDAVFYDPATKCCSYMPLMWNFLTGAVLSDDSPEATRGRRTVEARIDAGIAITPLAMERTPVYNLLYGHIPDAFGRARSMRCPHFIEEGGLCGVWRFRESTCATWFCKHERGAVAKEFWVRLHRLLALVERNLAGWCVLELDMGTDALRTIFPFPTPPDHPVTGGDFDGRPDPARQRALWGRWHGREREFYREAHGLVGRLGWRDVLGVCGPEVRAAEQIARKAFADLREQSLPSQLRAGLFRQQPLPDGGAMVTTYSPLDPLQLSPEILQILPYFQGQSAKAARNEIERELGFEVETELLRKLADFGLLRGS
ncbi:MAG TPA: hypothetical protein VG817_05030 [Gemmatimonadales bacterium]|nr:hypothetical protein [Gemmatimonadales bacterium]